MPPAPQPLVPPASAGLPASPAPSASLDAAAGQVPRHRAGLSACLALLLVAAAPAAAQYDVPYVPTPQPVVDAMLELARPGPGDYLIDLGSGDGRIVVTAAQRYQTPGLGVDLNPERIQEARANAAAAGVSAQVEFKQQDLFETDIGKATVLTMYLLPQVNLRLRPLILDRLAPGTRVVSHAFDMDDWEPDETRTVDGKQIYHWLVPARVQGTWSLSAGNGGSRTLNLQQKYQRIDGMLGGSHALQEGSLTGTDIRFVLPGEDGRPRRFTGTVQGNRMSGTTADGAPWTATRTG
ncbi:SAM-dependent methyltransferase [Oleisolibacter albus]|uniref:SAM-dependent methyltransferase n=1 Tax=Oleisolibacter albus TaxID=2171757 RepID=UPI000DF1554F|nr:class I SAM-dependent methyltransferase [Oleisolibacter albus]